MIATAAMLSQLTTTLPAMLARSFGSHGWELFLAKLSYYLFPVFTRRRGQHRGLWSSLRLHVNLEDQCCT